MHSCFGVHTVYSISIRSLCTLVSDHIYLVVSDTIPILPIPLHGFISICWIEHIVVDCLLTVCWSFSPSFVVCGAKILSSKPKHANVHVGRNFKSGILPSSSKRNGKVCLRKVQSTAARNLVSTTQLSFCMQLHYYPEADELREISLSLDPEYFGSIVCRADTFIRFCNQSFWKLCVTMVRSRHKLGF